MDAVTARILDQLQNSINRLVGLYNRTERKLHLALSRIDELEKKIAAIEEEIESDDECESPSDAYKCHGD